MERRPDSGFVCLGCKQGIFKLRGMMDHVWQRLLVTKLLHNVNPRVCLTLSRQQLLLGLNVLNYGRCKTLQRIPSGFQGGWILMGYQINELGTAVLQESLQVICFPMGVWWCLIRHLHVPLANKIPNLLEAVQHVSTGNRTCQGRLWRTVRDLGFMVPSQFSLSRSRNCERLTQLI